MKRVEQISLVAALSTIFVASLSTAASATCHSVGFSQSSYSVNEDAGSIEITINRQISGAGCTGKLDYSTGNGSATAPADFTSVSNSHQFAAPTSESFSFNVPIRNDSDVEGTEEFEVNFKHTPDDGQPSATGSASVVIQDNDQAAPPPPPPPPAPPKPSPSPAAASPGAPVAVPSPSPSPTLSPSPSPTTLAKAKESEGFPVVAIIAIAALLVAAGAGGLLYWVRKRPT